MSDVEHLAQLFEDLAFATYVWEKVGYPAGCSGRRPRTTSLPVDVAIVPKSTVLLSFEGSNEFVQNW